MRERRRSWMLLTLVAFATLVAITPATAASEGIGLVVAKDAATRTVILQGGPKLRVDEATRILDLEGRQMSFEELAVAPKVSGGWSVRGEAMVAYEAEATTGRAIRIQVVGLVH